MRRKFTMAIAIVLQFTLFQDTLFAQRLPDTVANIRIRTIADSNIVLQLDEMATSKLYTDVQSALAISIYTLEQSNRIGYQNGQIKSLLALGDALTLSGSLYQGLEAALKAVHIVEISKDKSLLWLVYMKCGVIYGNVGDYHSSIVYYKKALYDIIQPYPHNLTLYGLLGESFIQENMLDSALSYSQRAYELDINESKHWGVPYLNLGTIHTRYHHLPLALEYFRMTLSLPPLTLDSIAAKIGIAKIYQELGQKDSALHYTRRAIALDPQKNYPSFLIMAYGLMKDYFKSERQYDSAFLYQELMLSIKDSIYAKEKMNKIENLKFSDQLRRLDIEEANRQALKTRQHNLQFAGIGTGLITLIILFLTLSHSIIVSHRFVQLAGIVALLLLFEFINLFAHPFIGNITDHSPVWMFLILVCIAALLAPLHHRLEKWVVHQLVEKNKSIRVAAAKKILQENEQ